LGYESNTYSITLSFTVLRGTTEPHILRDAATRPFASSLPEVPSLISPVYAPHGNLSSIYGVCSPATVEIIRDMYNLTQTYLVRWSCASELDPGSNAQVMACDAQLRQIYNRLLHFPSAENDHMPDYIYESCRIAALLYCRSIVEGISLAESARSIHVVNTGQELRSTTLLSALHSAIMRTDIHSCWNNMRGVFMWICFIGGAASWASSRYTTTEQAENSSTPAWMRKCFALYAVKAAISIPLDQAGAAIQAFQTMLQVRHWMSVNNGSPIVSSFF
jgi:hypothetical protein